MRHLVFILLTLIGIFCFADAPKTLTVKSGQINFVATGHPSALKVVGHGNKVKGSLHLQSTIVEGNVSFDLGSLDTGVELRNHHMKEKYLEVAKYPEARLTLKKMNLPVAPLTPGFKVADLPFSGDLMLHGITKPVHGTVSIVNNSGELVCDAQFQIKISDYSIAVPKYLGITIADDVQVNTHTSLQ